MGDNGKRAEVHGRPLAPTETVLFMHSQGISPQTILDWLDAEQPFWKAEAPWEVLELADGTFAVVYGLIYSNRDDADEFCSSINGLVGKEG